MEWAGGRPKVISLKSQNGFKLTPEDLKKNIEPGIKGILLNYPSNPTGVSYSKKELIALDRILTKHNIFVISDEIYDELTYDFKHTAFATLPGAKERTVYLNGFSKAYAMTGWRVGFACGPKEIIACMNKRFRDTFIGIF